MVDNGSPGPKRYPLPTVFCLDVFEVTCLSLTALAAKVALETGTAETGTATTAAASKEKILAKGGDGSRMTSVCPSVCLHSSVGLGLCK